MSAQIIRALRQRADQLDAEREALNGRIPDGHPERAPWMLELVVTEFRALADAAEEPPEPPLRGVV